MKNSRDIVTVLTEAITDYDGTVIGYYEKPLDTLYGGDILAAIEEIKQLREKVSRASWEADFRSGNVQGMW